MSQQVPLEPVAGFDRTAQREWMRSLRSRTAHIELVFHDGDTDHPLSRTLAWLEPSRWVGVGVRPGYHRPQPTAVLHRYSYDRAILHALDDLGGIFEYVSTPTGDLARFTRLGNVDVTFLDRHGSVLGSTVTHEGLVWCSPSSGVVIGNGTVDGAGSERTRPYSSTSTRCPAITNFSLQCFLHESCGQRYRPGFRIVRPVAQLEAVETAVTQGTHQRADVRDDVPQDDPGPGQWLHHGLGVSSRNRLLACPGGAC
jgi:hypothetical protein